MARRGITAWIFGPLAAALLAGPSPAAEEYRPGTPFTYVFDTGTRAGQPLASQVLAARAGWTLLPEDETQHTFQGDAVLLNDQIAVVLRCQGEGAEVYRQAGAAWKRRAEVDPVSARGSSQLALESFRVVENTRGNVALAQKRRSKEEQTAVEYRLATGQAMLEVRPGEGTAGIRVVSQARYVVVPDFFGDDAVVGRPSASARALGLPAENFFLNLLEGNDSLLMTVWQSDRLGDVMFRAAEEKLADCRIGCSKGKSVWVAVLEGPRIWHEREAAAADFGKEIGLDWTPPFAAKWRADFPRPDGTAASWYFTGSGDEGAAAGLVRAEGPCRFDAGRAMVRLGDRSSGAAQGPVVVYPIDRSRATPLTVLLPIDVLRNTLGVGPCQYILQSEGLAGETNPTPDEVMNWVERELKRKKRPETEAVRQRLEEMAAHVGRVQSRIDKYGEFAAEVRKLAADEALRPIVERIGAAAKGPAATAPVDRIAKLNDALLASFAKKDSQADVARLATEIRRLGAEQERSLANCRMAVRWLWTRSTGPLRARAEAILQKP